MPPLLLLFIISVFLRWEFPYQNYTIEKKINLHNTLPKFGEKYRKSQTKNKPKFVTITSMEYKSFYKNEKTIVS